MITFMVNALFQKDEQLKAMAIQIADLQKQLMGNQAVIVPTTTELVK